jgi:hypothetical protein
MNEPVVRIGVVMRRNVHGVVISRLVFGLVVLGFGVIFLMDELGVVNASAILRYWAIIPLTYGIMRLAGVWCRQNLVSGMIFTLLGSWFLLRALHLLPYGLHDFWPVLLIMIGISLVTGGLRRVRDGGSEGEAASMINAFAFWSGVDRKVTATDFQGGDITAVMGGHEIDLRSARMAGDHAVIDLFVLMGGVDMRIPEDWTVSCDAVPIMGGVEDRTRPPAGEVKGKLILRGFIMMGGVEVKN